MADETLRPLWPAGWRPSTGRPRMGRPSTPDRHNPDGTRTLRVQAAAWDDTETEP